MTLVHCEGIGLFGAAHRRFGPLSSIDRRIVLPRLAHRAFSFGRIISRRLPARKRILRTR